MKLSASPFQSIVLLFAFEVFQLCIFAVDDEDRVGNSLLQIWKLRFGHKVKLLSRLCAQGLVKILKLNFRRDFEARDWSVFCCWCFVHVWSWVLVEILKLGLVKILNISRDADVLLRFRSWCLVEIWSRFVFELMIWPKQITWSAELNPQVLCAFGNVLHLDWTNSLAEFSSTYQTAKPR